MMKCIKMVLFPFFIIMFSSKLYAFETSWQKTSHTEHRLFSSQNTVRESQTFLLGFHVKLTSDWHIYWKNSGDAGFPPRLNFSDSVGIESMEILFPFPKRYDLRGGIASFGYENEVIYPIKVKVKSGCKKVQIRLKIDYLICKQMCVPYQANFELDIPVIPTRQEIEFDKKNARTLRFAYNNLPKEWAQDKRNFNNVVIQEEKFDACGFTLKLKVKDTTDINRFNVFFEPHKTFHFKKPEKHISDNEISVHVPVAWNKDKNVNSEKILIKHPVYYVFGLDYSDGRSSSFRKKISGINPSISPLSWVWMIIFSLIGGFLLNLMPCVLPVLSLKVFGFLKEIDSARKQIQIGALMTTLGILTSFFLLAMSLIIIRQTGYAIGWGIQFQEPLFILFLSLVVFAFAGNLFGLFEIELPSSFSFSLSNKMSQYESNKLLMHFIYGFFATLLATPCSAPFLGTAIGFAFGQNAWGMMIIFMSVGLGLAIPYLLFAIRPEILRIMPKPGNWMNILRKILGGFLLATLVWLLFVLSNQVSMFTMVILATILVIMALCLVCIYWANTKFYNKSSLKKIAVILFWILFISSFPFVHLSKITGINNQTVNKNMKKGLIQWEVFSFEKLEKYLNEDKNVFIDITADWCVTCKVNERWVLSSKVVAELFKSKNIIPLKADWTLKDSAITKYIARHGKSGVPFYIIYAGKEKHKVLSEVLTIKKLKRDIEDIIS